MDFKRLHHRLRGTQKLERINLVGTPFSDAMPAASLHWIIADKSEAIVAESTATGLHIYDNPAGVLTNNPPFEMQMQNLSNYISLSPSQPENTFAPDVPLAAYSRGMGALGLPGDLSSQSRFVRAAFTRAHSVSECGERESVNQFSTFSAAWSSKGAAVRLKRENMKSRFTHPAAARTREFIITLPMKTAKSRQLI